MPENDMLNDDNLGLTDEEEEEWWKESFEDDLPDEDKK